jgi:hypothetical protein
MCPWGDLNRQTNIDTKTCKNSPRTYLSITQNGSEGEFCMGRQEKGKSKARKCFWLLIGGKCKLGAL